MQQLKAYLKSKGVHMFTNERVLDFNMKQGKIDSVVTDKQTLHSDEFVMASGSWSADLCKKIGFKITASSGEGLQHANRIQNRN